MDYSKVFISYKERRELDEWWAEQVRKAKEEGRWPVQWSPKRDSKQKKTKRPVIDSEEEQSYTDDNTSLSSENPLPSPGQGVLYFKDKD